jgi:hypothetical protein
MAHCGAGLIDLGLFSVGYGDQDFGQFVGGAELPWTRRLRA